MANSPSEADLKREATGKVAPKPPAQHRLVGQSLPRVDLPAKVTGGAAFVQDLRLPGMVHGRIARPPQYGAQLEAFDEAKVRAMPGVVAVVRDGSFLGVAAEREEQAIKAVEALSASAKWKAGPATARSGAALRAAEDDADAGHRHQQQGRAAAGVRRARWSRRPIAGRIRRTPRWGRPARSRSCGTGS